MAWLTAIRSFFAFALFYIVSVVITPLSGETIHNLTLVALVGILTSFFVGGICGLAEGEYPRGYTPTQEERIHHEKLDEALVTAVLVISVLVGITTVAMAGDILLNPGMVLGKASILSLAGSCVSSLIFVITKRMQDTTLNDLSRSLAMIQIILLVIVLGIAMWLGFSAEIATLTPAGVLITVAIGVIVFIYRYRTYSGISNYEYVDDYSW